MNAALQRLLPASMSDLSACGCLLQIQSPVPVGSIGLLDVEIEGIRYAEWFRVVRIELSSCVGEPHVIGVEFLQLAPAGEQSLRGAMRSKRIGRSPRINLAAPGKLSGNTGTSARALQVAGGQRGRNTREFSSGSSRSRRVEGSARRGNTVAQETLARTARERTPITTTGEDDMQNFIARFVRDDQGQDLIEYILIATFVSVGALAGATALGTSLNGWYNAAAGWVGRSQGPFGGGGAQQP